MKEDPPRNDDDFVHRRHRRVGAAARHPGGSFALTISRDFSPWADPQGRPALAERAPASPLGGICEDMTGDDRPAGAHTRYPPVYRLAEPGRPAHATGAAIRARAVLA